MATAPPQRSLQASQDTIDGSPFNVRFGSKAEVKTFYFDVRFTPRKRTSIERVGMSALCQKQALSHLFDYGVGAFGTVASASQSSGSR